MTRSLSRNEKELLKGVELITWKLLNTLKSKGLEQVEVTASDVFDAEIHEAITQIPCAYGGIKRENY